MNDTKMIFSIIHQFTLHYGWSKFMKYCILLQTYLCAIIVQFRNQTTKLLNFEQKQLRMEVAQESLTMPQPPYSPDMAPCYFSLFPKIKRILKGRRFTAIDDIKNAPLKELKAIPKINFEKCFEDWKKRWQKCIIFNGEYFEGDNINVDE